VKGSFHSFRHAIATTLITNGANIKVVEDFLGHAQIKTIMKYLHALDSQKKEAMASINSIEVSCRYRQKRDFKHI
jgi:site-specific recombinase XerD